MTVIRAADAFERAHEWKNIAPHSDNGTEPVMHAESPITVARIQMSPDWREGSPCGALIGEDWRGGGQGRQLIVLPELWNSGYVFASRQEAFALAETGPIGPSTQAWSEAAHRTGAVIVAGICERAGDALYNSAAIVGPDGFIGTYRKVHLWGAENLFSSPEIWVCPWEGAVRPNGGRDLL